MQPFDVISEWSFSHLPPLLDEAFDDSLVFGETDITELSHPATFLEE